MTVYCLGTSHHSAPVEFLEKVLRAAGDVHERFVAETRGGAPARYPFDELVVLSTCNRIELYAAVHDDRLNAADAGLRQELLDSTGLPDGTGPEEVFYTRQGPAAVTHLSRVAIGLDSLVVGEHEIAGQVTRAFEGVVRRFDDSCVLWAVGETARAASRRARSETAIGRGPASISSVAVGLVREAVGDLSGRKVVVVGAGKMGRLACQALLPLKPAELVLVGRTRERTEETARALGATPATPADLVDAIRGADVVFTSTSSPDTVIDVPVIQAAGRGANEADSLVIVDVAVPRDVAPNVADLPGVRLYDMDNLRGRIEKHLEDRRSEIPRAEAIVAEEVGAYEQRLRQARMRPLISALRSQAEGIRRVETERVLAELSEVGELGPVFRERLDRFSRTLVDRLLREPTARLRESPDAETAKALDRATRELFGLGSGGPASTTNPW